MSDKLREALTGIAAFDDTYANEWLEKTGSYSQFDEPGAVKAARAALAQPQNDAEAGRWLIHYCGEEIFSKHKGAVDFYAGLGCKIEPLYTAPPSSRMREALDEDPLADRLLGRASFLRDRGEIKSPELMEKAAQTLRAGDNHAGQKKPFDQTFSAETVLMESFFPGGNHASDGKESGKCPKCGAFSGDDWSQCRGRPCPMGGPTAPDKIKPRKVATLEDQTCDKCEGTGIVSAAKCPQCLGEGSYETVVMARKLPSDDLGAPLERIRTEAARMGYALVPNDGSRITDLRAAYNEGLANASHGILWNQSLTATRALRGGE